MTVFPTLEDVEHADIVALTRWMRFLPTASNDAQLDVINRVFARWREEKERDPGAAVAASKQVGLG